MIYHRLKIDFFLKKPVSFVENLRFFLCVNNLDAYVWISQQKIADIILFPADTGTGELTMINED